jgi:pilus assembly protein CpaF
MTDELQQRIRALETQVALLSRAVGESIIPAEVAVDPRAALSDAVMALAPLKPLLDDDSINDILINGPKNIYVERAGKLTKTDLVLPDEAEVFAIARAIAAQVGREVDARRPLLDARLPDGSRVNIIAPPLAIDGTAISIRKFAKRSITLDMMRDSGNMSGPLAEFLKVVARCKMNIIISGGTGSGKTTLLNAISQFIDDDERVVTIEDAAELRLQQPHVVRLETRPVRSGGQRDEEVTIRDLMKNALRMRPDRIIMGEVRGSEAFDMMQAMNTGHEGSLTTIHANHPRDALARLENMMMMANLNLPSQAMRAQIASAVHLIVQISRMRDGRRRVAYVSEVVGMESDIITMQDLFSFQTKGEGPDGALQGDFRWSGIMPRFLRRVMYYGEGERLSNALGVKLPKL